MKEHMYGKPEHISLPCMRPVFVLYVTGVRNHDMGSAANKA